MAFDITKKRASEKAEIELVNGDGSPLLDDASKVLSVTMFGPGSKTYQLAQAETRRRMRVRMDKNRNRVSAALENEAEDELDFLLAVTVSFNGWEYPHPEGGEWPSQRDMFAAAYSDTSIGYIRDHLLTEIKDWSAFTKGSAKS